MHLVSVQVYDTQVSNVYLHERDTLCGNIVAKNFRSKTPWLYFSWVQGYDGSDAHYITRDVICFKCGNFIKFVAEDGHESVFPSPGEGIGPLAVHPHNKVFALCDLGIGPTIYVIQYPSFRILTELKGIILL